MRHGTPSTLLRITRRANQCLCILWQNVANDLFDQGPIEAVVTGGHWSMRRKQTALGQLFSTPSPIQEFKHCEGAMSFVQVQALHININVIEQLDATNAEYILLSNAYMIVSSVES